MRYRTNRLHRLRSIPGNVDHLRVANAKFDTVFGDPWINLWVFGTIEDYIDHVGLARIEHLVDALGDSGIGQFVWEADFNFNGGDFHFGTLEQITDGEGQISKRGRRSNENRQCPAEVSAD